MDAPPVPVPAVLSPADVADLIVRPSCGGIDVRTPEGVLLRDRLLAKMRHESGLRPLVVRVEDEGRALPPFRSAREAEAEATRRLEASQTLGLGLGQTTHKDNLVADFGVADWRDAVPLAFRPCEAVRATVRHYAGDLAYVMRAMDCASTAYNAGRARLASAGCDTRYAAAVRALQAAIPADLAAGPARVQARPVSASVRRPAVAGVSDPPRAPRVSPAAGPGAGDAFARPGGAFAAPGAAFARAPGAVAATQETAP